MGTGATTGSILIGGVGKDLLTGTDGDDVIVGDGGRVARTNGVATKVESFDVFGLFVYGDVDTINGAGGSDVVIGGAGGATTTAGPAAGITPRGPRPAHVRR